MLKKTIKYEDFNGEEVVDDFYFNLTKAEIAEKQNSVEGGWAESLIRIGNSDDSNAILQEFKSIIESSVGRKSEDGKRFIKDQEAKDAFFQSNAYDTLLWDMMTNPDTAAEIITSIFPKDLVEAAQKGEDIFAKKDAPNPFKAVEEPAREQDTRPAWVKEDRDPTQEELTKMSKEELTEAFRQKNRRDREK
jgi:hypothetical protein